MKFSITYFFYKCDEILSFQSTTSFSCTVHGNKRVVITKNFEKYRSARAIFLENNLSKKS